MEMRYLIYNFFHWSSKHNRHIVLWKSWNILNDIRSDPLRIVGTTKQIVRADFIIRMVFPPIPSSKIPEKNCIKKLA